MFSRFSLKSLAYYLAGITGFGGGTTVTYIEATRPYHKTWWRKTIKTTGPVKDCREDNVYYLWDFRATKDGGVELVRSNSISEGTTSGPTNCGGSESEKKKIEKVEVKENCVRGFLSITCDIEIKPEGDSSNSSWSNNHKSTINYSVF